MDSDPDLEKNGRFTQQQDTKDARQSHRPSRSGEADNPAGADVDDPPIRRAPEGQPPVDVVMQEVDVKEPTIYSPSPKAASLSVDGQPQTLRDNDTEEHRSTISSSSYRGNAALATVQASHHAGGKWHSRPSVDSHPQHSTNTPSLLGKTPEGAEVPGDDKAATRRHAAKRPPLAESRATVERQIEIYLADLAAITREYSNEKLPSYLDFFLDGQNDPSSPISSDAGSINNGHGAGNISRDEDDLEDVLEGLRYVMESSIDGGRMPHLDSRLMKALSTLLLITAKHKETYLLIGHKLTEEAHMAFALFGDFLEEVYEFRLAVGQMTATDLKHRLKLHTRLNDDAEDDQKHAALAILGILVNRFPQYSDWRELVVHEEHDEVEDIIEENKEMWETPRMPEPKPVLCPPGLYYDRSSEKVAYMFETNTKTGLSAESMPKLIDWYGPNKLPSPPSTPKWKMLLRQLLDFMTIILIIAAIVSIAVEDEGVKTATVLLIVVVLNVTIGFVQEVKANRALEALMSLSVPKARVIRDGQDTMIESCDLVPGDVVILEEGDSVPADLRLIQTSQLEIIETILSGESVAVEKDIAPIKSRARKLPLGDCKGNAFMATVVARGRGKGIVVRTGDDTEIGKISSAITNTPNVVTPIERKLKRLGIWLVALAVLLSILIVIINVVRGNNLKETIKVGVSLAVSVIPEGLVTVVTITMALAVRRMAQRSAIVRKMPSVETLGSVTVICSDKTGTLTEGKMGASTIWLSSDELFTFTASTSIDPNKGKILSTPHQEGKIVKTAPKMEVDSENISLHLQLTLMACALCSNARISFEDNEWKRIGDPTEVALVIASMKAKLSREVWEMQHGMERLEEFAFDSDRKLMSVLYGSPDTSPFIFTKGAPERVLAKCASYLTATSFRDQSARHLQPTVLNGVATTPMNKDFVSTISARALTMANSGLRVLGLAYRPVTGDHVTSAQVAEKNLCFIGLIGLIDPPRQGVKESVNECKTAGIKVIMITGDHIATASAIAHQLGIMDNTRANGRAMKGTELDVLSQDQIGSLDPFPTVFARVSPDNKLAIVKALQKKGHSVAMTGDGVNDAPAIKAANVGVAMGVGGTEITKQAADIVLANDDFSTIVDAVEEGRRVFDNIQKFLVYLLSCNSCEIWVMLFSAIIGKEMPLTSMMILFANIIADVPPSMALGLEPPEKDVMLREPRDPQAPVLSTGAALIVALQGLVLAAISLGIYFWALEVGDIGLHEAKTLCFVTLTLLQLNQGFLSRSVHSSIFRTGVMENRWMIGAWFLSVGLLFIGTMVPAVADLIDCVPLFRGSEWIGIGIACVAHFICSEAIKFMYRAILRRRRYFKESRARKTADSLERADSLTALHGAGAKWQSRKQSRTQRLTQCFPRFMQRSSYAQRKKKSFS